MANVFADHFRKVGHYMVDLISGRTHNHRKCVPSKVDKTIFIYPIQFLEYQEVVPGISIFLFKDLADVLFQPLDIF